MCPFTQRNTTPVSLTDETPLQARPQPWGMERTHLSVVIGFGASKEWGGGSTGKAETAATAQSSTA